MSDVATSADQPGFEADRHVQELAVLEADLAEVAVALGRLDDGSYGTCEVCGVEIIQADPVDPLRRRCVNHGAPAALVSGPGQLPFGI